MPTIFPSIAPPVTNSDGTVTIVKTITETWQPDEYVSYTTNLQNVITAEQAKLAIAQPIATQVQAIITSLQAAQAQLISNNNINPGSASASP